MRIIESSNSWCAKQQAGSNITGEVEVAPVLPIQRSPWIREGVIGVGVERRRGREERIWVGGEGGEGGRGFVSNDRKVRLDEEQSDELTKRSLAAKTARAYTSVSGAPPPQPTQ